MSVTERDSISSDVGSSSLRLSRQATRHDGMSMYKSAPFAASTDHQHHEQLRQRRLQLVLRRYIRHHPEDLASRIAGDILVALAVTASVSPLLTVVDKAVVQQSSGAYKSLTSSALASVTSMAQHPVAFLKSPTFLWMWMTYAVTYSAANVLKTVGEHREYQTLLSAEESRKHQHQQERNRHGNLKTTIQSSSASASASPYTLFLGTTLVNSGASLVKDRAYAKLFGNASATTVPRISYALWMIRDFAVIGSSFVLPAYASPILAEQFKGHITTDQANTISQVGVPVFAQFVATPLHLVGLDCYNRNLAGSSISQRIVERTRSLAGSFHAVVAARMLRVLPGYGIAGVYNAQWRNSWRNHLMERRVKSVKRQIGNDKTSLKEMVALIQSKS